MGVCTTKQEKKINKFPVERLFPVVDTKSNESEPAKSEFYYFVEWMISFNFYKRLHNSQESANINILNNDPKQSSIFKLIKAIDCSFLREKINSFSINSDVTQLNKQMPSGDMEKEQLKSVFFSLAKTNMSKVQKLLTEGPPNNMRWFIWLTLARIGYEEVETKLVIDNSVIYKTIFSSSFDAMRSSINKEPTVSNAFDLFNSNYNYRACLINVITANMTYDKRISGSLSSSSSSSIAVNNLVNIIANALIVSDFNEEEAFYIVRYIYSSEYGLKLRELIHNEAPKVKYYAYIVERLLDSRCPEVSKYFNQMNMNKGAIVTKWIQSLFCFLDISVCIRVWDCVFAYGLDFLINFSLGCFKCCEKAIIESQLNDFNQLNDMIKTHINIEKAIRFGIDFHISKYTQIQFDQGFFSHLLNNESNSQSQSQSHSEHESSVIDKNSDNNNNNHPNHDYKKMNKIKLLYHTNFSNDNDINNSHPNYNFNFNHSTKEGMDKMPPEEKKSKIAAVKKLKEIYFKEDNGFGVIDNDETQMLCSLVNKSYTDYEKEKEEDKKILLKVQRYQSNSNINKTKSHKVNHVRFHSKASQNDICSGLQSKRNHSVMELNNEDNDSSDLSSINHKYHNYSIIDQIDGNDHISVLKKNGSGENDKELKVNGISAMSGDIRDLDKSLEKDKDNEHQDNDNDNDKNKGKDKMDSSIITPEDLNEDSYDEEAMIKMIEDKGMESFFKENAPKKIVKINP